MLKATHFKSAHRVLTVEKHPKGSKPLGSISGSGVSMSRKATVQLRKVLGGASVIETLGQEGQKLKVATLQALESTDHTHGQAGGRSVHTVPLLIEKEAIAEVVAGASPRAVEVRYDLASGYVAHALRRRYGSSEAAKQSLLGLVSEVAIACNVHALTQVPAMTGPQAVMAGAIAIDKVLALEKSIDEKPKTINFDALARVGKTLKVLREIVQKKQP